MVRSAAAVLAVLILPGLALAQQSQGTHTVIRDDTLWDLSERYYSNPFEWRLIWEANRTVIDDPNLIYPDQVLTIPGQPARDATAQGGAPAGGGAPGGGGQPAQPVQPTQGPAVSAADARTIFYRNQPDAASVVGMREREYIAVDIDQVYSAPWLGPLVEVPQHVGTLLGFALSTDRGSTMRQFHQVNVRTNEPVRVGDEYRTYRVSRTIPRVGQVVTPTGILSVTAVHDSGAVAVITEEYDRIQDGDLIGPLPPYSMVAGQYAADVTGGSEAMIMGFAGTAQLNEIGQHAFLDLGTDHGIGLGDEFVLFSDAVRT
ncbi:MAG: LysM peptidoglycan-binding domain-containing protein [Thioalkalivibrio sp.]|nr:LysM peptidoglycan-binding domain-containing protein [Thioalkalivibrio sp.]